MWELLGRLFVRLLVGPLNWRFRVGLAAIVLIGVFVMQHVPNGTPSTVVGGILLALGVGGGIWWKSLWKTFVQRRKLTDSCRKPLQSAC